MFKKGYNEKYFLVGVASITLISTKLVLTGVSIDGFEDPVAIEYRV